MQTSGLKESCRYTSVGRGGSALGHPNRDGAAGGSSSVTSPRLNFVLLQLIDLHLSTARNLQVNPTGPPLTPPNPKGYGAAPHPNPLPQHHPPLPWVTCSSGAGC
uniref:Uncharacterized protein n=1 Tax=Phasianus colchicus TaxID=9054 RepID=A0A669QDI0_PHACC